MVSSRVLVGTECVKVVSGRVAGHRREFLPETNLRLRRIGVIDFVMSQVVEAESLTSTVRNAVMRVLALLRYPISMPTITRIVPNC